MKMSLPVLKKIIQYAIDCIALSDIVSCSIDSDSLVVTSQVRKAKITEFSGGWYINNYYNNMPTATVIIEDPAHKEKLAELSAEIVSQFEKDALIAEIKEEFKI